LLPPKLSDLIKMVMMFHAAAFALYLFNGRFPIF
jgi:hypothetical protein